MSRSPNGATCRVGQRRMSGTRRSPPSERQPRATIRVRVPLFKPMPSISLREILRTLTKEDGLLVAEQVDDEVAAGLPEGGGGGADERDGGARPRGPLLLRLL